ncbi:MAG TPA: CmcJ/NvfI family oxidoreductase, partial [Stellaceae bacterium]|nr:CmcJ/NvfI family oxidoreductase [Stellaceae bacterium]
IFDHTLRHRIPGFEDRRDGPRQPALRVHIDHTAKSGPQRVRDFLPDEAEELLKGRVQVINFWRPIHHPVYDAPLAVCDAKSVAPADLVPSDLVYEHRVGETYAVTYNPGHRWFYLSEMRPDEALLIKCCDTATVPARFTPHTAFLHPEAAPDAPPRESIEIRALVFHRQGWDG